MPVGAFLGWTGEQVKPKGELSLDQKEKEERGKKKKVEEGQKPTRPSINRKGGKYFENPGKFQGKVTFSTE